MISVVKLSLCPTSYPPNIVIFILVAFPLDLILGTLFYSFCTNLFYYSKYSHGCHCQLNIVMHCLHITLVFCNTFCCCYSSQIRWLLQSSSEPFGFLTLLFLWWQHMQDEDAGRPYRKFLWVLRQCFTITVGQGSLRDHRFHSPCMGKFSFVNVNVHQTSCYANLRFILDCIFLSRIRHNQ